MKRNSLYLLLLSVLLTVVGGSWFQNTIPVTNVDFVSAVFSSSTTAVMVGYNDDSGAIIKTTNSGFTWTTVSTSVAQTTDVATINIGGVTYFLAVSIAGTIYLSTAGGTFNAVRTLPATLYGVAIGSNNKAYACGVTAFPPLSKIYASSFSTFNTSYGYGTWDDVTPPGGSQVLSADSFIK